MTGELGVTVPRLWLNKLRFIAGFVVSLTLLVSLTGCFADTTTDKIEIGAQTVILDVRSQSEFAAGHLPGAKLLDFNSGEFTAAIPTLDKNAEYLIYCRSGNRAGKALIQLSNAGFTNVQNLGSLETAAKLTGLEIEK